MFKQAKNSFPVWQLWSALDSYGWSDLIVTFVYDSFVNIYDIWSDRLVFKSIPDQLPKLVDLKFMKSFVCIWRLESYSRIVKWQIKKMGEQISFNFISSSWLLSDHCCISIHTQDCSYLLPNSFKFSYPSLISELTMNHEKV